MFHSVDLEGFVARISEDYVTKFAPRKAHKSVTPGKLTFDDRVVLHRADR